MKNPIEPVGLFATPSNIKEFQDYLARFNGPDAVVANTAAFMAWNLCSKIVDETIEKESK